MKSIQYLIAVAIALLVTASCEVNREIVPEEPEASVKLVPMTFSAMQVLDGVDDTDTKVALDGMNIHWKAGDKIAVFDDFDPTVKHEFIATSSGAETSFSGSVNADAKQFFAVYPYSAADNCVMQSFTSNSVNYFGYVNANIPSEQKAVAGGFDPDAAILAASTDIIKKSFAFRIPFALAKFSVIYDDVKSVSFSSGKNMTGSLRINMRENGNIGTQDGEGTKAKSLTISNADGSPLTKDATYYVVLRYRVGNSAYTDFTVNVERAGWKSGFASASGDVSIDRNKIKNLGNFSGMHFTTNLYSAYQEGKDIEIAGKTYNKANYGDAVELNPSQTITDSRVKGVSAQVFFLKPGCSYESGGITIDKNVIIASEDPDNRATITPSSSWKLQSGSLVLEGAVLDMRSLTTSGTSVSFFSNSGATVDFSSLVLSKCRMSETQNEKNMILFQPISTSAGFCINEIAFRNCLFAMGGSFTTLINATNNATAAWNYKRLELSDNIIYSYTGSLVKTIFFNYTQTKENDAVNNWTCNVDIQRNLFYDIYANGLVNNYDLGGVTVNNNLFVAADTENDPGAGFKLIRLYGASNGSNYSSSTSCDKNSYYGTMAGNRKWTLGDSPFLTGYLTNPSACPTNPITSANVTTGEFAINSEYADYGPNPIPAP